MTDLTEKILSLDLRSASALKDAKALSVIAKKNADKYNDHNMKEVKKLFEKEKSTEAKALAEGFEEERKRARLNLDQKMKTFDEDMKIDAIVGSLLKVTKERICL